MLEDSVKNVHSYTHLKLQDLKGAGGEMTDAGGERTECSLIYAPHTCRFQWLAEGE